MLAYILRRLLLIIPTLLGIMVINFAVIQAAPGGPVERTIAAYEGRDVGALARVSGGGEAVMDGNTQAGKARRGLTPEQIEQIRRQYGFDKPPVERFLLMMGNFIRFDFGESFFRNRSVVDLVKDKLPVSISLGLWSLLLIYGISIPLGIIKAVRDGSRFDVWSSAAIIIGYAVPGFLFALLLIILFAGGSYWQWFPLRGLVSENFASLSVFGKITDYLWHMVLPITALVIGGFASLTMLTKNSFIDEIGKQYVLTARARGLTENRVLYGHVFRNAMLLVIAGFPASFIALMFTGSFLIEVIFSLDGLGLLGFEAAINRDYPVMFGTLYVFTLLGLLLNLLGDVMYTVVDPRIDFEGRHG
jgi:microcin C transport system permease protein